MLMHQTLSKGWCHAGSRLLLGLIVRASRRLVEAQALFGATENWSSSPAYRPRGHHLGNTRAVASLEKRARFLALCSRTSAPLLPEPLFPKPTKPEGALRGARFAQLPACSGPNALWSFGGLPSVLDTTLIPAIVRVRASRKRLFSASKPPSGGAPPKPSGSTASRWHFRLAQRA
jgi:hypothetical protein